MNFETLIIYGIVHIIKIVAYYYIPYLNIKAKWKMQHLSKLLIEYITGVSFVSVRPEWLKNPMTGRNLELDCYNDELSIALEYNGKQHYKYTPRFHKSTEEFELQVYRDILKKKLCNKNGVDLIIVPYTVQKEEICSYILRKLYRIKEARQKYSTEG